MTKVRFYDRADDGLLRYAVIAARTGGRWVFCRHRERDTLELPGGHRAPGEDLLWDILWSMMYAFPSEYPLPPITFIFWLLI